MALRRLSINPQLIIFFVAHCVAYLYLHASADVAFSLRPSRATTCCADDFLFARSSKIASFVTRKEKDFFNCVYIFQKFFLNM